MQTLIKLRDQLLIDFQNIFATKTELKNLSNKMTQGFTWVIEEFTKMRSEMVTKSDLADIMGELKAIRSICL
jgi:hypothetical protein